MIFELPDTTTQQISKTLTRLRESGTQVTTGRVLTLIVVTDSESDVAAVTESTNEASREHPSRVIILVVGDKTAENKVDAEVRIGGDAGASEMIIMHLNGPVADKLQYVVTPLLLPDTPIVAWWPGESPKNPSQDPIGRIAQRRITDALYDRDDALEDRVENYHPGDTDMTWARLTQWRGLVASSLDHPPHSEITSVRLTGASDSTSVDLAAGWLARLAQANQVIVVTHLPQVAAYADTHLHVAKDVSDTSVTSGVITLSKEERVEELARMLAGLDDTATGRAHASELLSKAQEEVEGFRA